MVPQFVDFNADGHVDIVTATFDGSPHVAYGGEGGFAQPERFLDENGERLLLDQFWNYESEAWEEADRAGGGSEDGDHCISAVAYDWDGDDDLDLILGAYKSGRLYLQRNEGTPEEPSFPGVNEPIQVAGAPHAVPGYMTSPVVVDWDGDGVLDLLTGSFGDCWGRDTGGGVQLLRNGGGNGEPAFEAPRTLIERSAKTNEHEPLRPDAGLYAFPFDYDGDGDLDLLVGGYSMWDPIAPELTAEQVARADALEAEIEALGAKRQAMTSEALDGAEDVQVAYQALREDPAYKGIGEALAAATEELETLRPKAKREAAVWLYERLGEPTSTPVDAGATKQR